LQQTQADTRGQRRLYEGLTQCGHRGVGSISKKLTQKDVKTLEAPETGNRICYDSEISGFGVRVTAAGKRAFVLNYRNHFGRERRITIGQHPAWNLAGARTEAKTLLQGIDRGHDPLDRRTENRTALTVAELCDRYKVEHLPKKHASSQKEDLSMIEKVIVPALGTLKAKDVDFADVHALHRKITTGINGRRRTPYRANRVLALLSKMFNLAILWKIRDDNPCKGVEKNDEPPRERFLTKAELTSIVKALTEFEDRESANAMMLALLTGARRGELLKATWGQFDLVSLAEGVWTKPSAHTKQSKLHRVPLSADAIELLTAMRADAEPDATHLFPSRINARGGVDIRRPWERLCLAAGLAEKAKDGRIKTTIRFHDLRHSFASLLASSGRSLPIIGQLLGHTQAQTTMRYAHLADEPLREATNRVGKRIREA
jgi:integrase